MIEANFQPKINMKNLKKYPKWFRSFKYKKMKQQEQESKLILIKIQNFAITLHNLENKIKKINKNINMKF